MISHENESVILLNSEVQKDAAITGHDILPDGDSASVAFVTTEANGASATSSIPLSGDIFVDGSAKTPRLIELEDRIGVLWGKYANRRFSEGISERELALEVGVSQTGVRKWNKKDGIVPLPIKDRQKAAAEAEIGMEWKDYVERRFAAGASTGDLARELGINRNKVGSLNRQEGLTLSQGEKKRLSVEVMLGESWQNYATRMLESGMSEASLARQFGLSPKLVRSWNRESGLTPLSALERNMRLVEARLTEQGTSLEEAIQTGEAKKLPPRAIVQGLGISGKRSRQVYDRVGIAYPSASEILRRQWEDPHTRESRSAGNAASWKNLSAEERSKRVAPKTPEARARKHGHRKKKSGIA